MDFHSLSRRELQALCKSKGIRANMSNAAMAEALLQCLPSVTVDGTDEIGSTAPPPPPPISAMKEAIVTEEQTHGSLLPRGGRARDKTRMVAADSMEEDVPDLTLQGCQRTAAAPEAEEAIAVEQEHGCPLPRGVRARGNGKTRKAGARKMEEVVAPAPHTLPGNKRTVAEEAAAPVDAEEVAVGMRTRKSARSKVKIALDEKEEDEQAEAAVRKEQKVSDKSCHDSEEHAVVAAVEEEITKPQEGQNVTRRAAPCKTHEDLQQDQRTVEEVATAKKRTRRSTRSKVAAAEQKEHKAGSSDAAIAPAVVSDKSSGDSEEHAVGIVVEEELTKPQEDQNVTRRATPYRAHEDMQQDQRTEEVATVKKRTRRSTRSKIAAAARKGQKGPEVDPKDDEVVPKVEETTKPQENKNVTRRATTFKAQEELHPGPVTVAPEAMAAVQAEEVATAKRRRRPARSKVRVAAWKGQKADSSDAVNGITLSDDPKEKQVAEVVDEGPTKPNEGDPKDDEVVPKVDETTKPQESRNVTRRAAMYKAQEEVQPGQVTVAPEPMAAVEAEEVATTKRRRKPARSKVRVAARKGQKADSSDAVNGSTLTDDPKEKQVAEVVDEGPTKPNEVDPKDDEVVPKVDETTKPQESRNVTRRATMYKAQEEVQPGQVTVAPEAMAAVEAEEVATAKRRRRRSARSKVRVAAWKGQKADSSDAVNGSTLSDDPKEKQVADVVEEVPTKPNEEEREQVSNVRQFASLPKLEDSPILGVVSKPNAADAFDKAAVGDEEAIKEDDFTFTGEADLSNLLVNTLDKFAKPMYVSTDVTDKEEKKGGECWWMLL